MQEEREGLVMEDKRRGSRFPYASGKGLCTARSGADSRIGGAGQYNSIRDPKSLCTFEMAVVPSI